MVQFANPAALWLLTLIIPLILLYLLKQRRRDYIVPSLLLWKQAMEDIRAQAPFQKLRSSLLLLLQILILVLATAVLSEPYVLQSPLQSSRWILILDSSAGMQATDVSPNRFHVAKNRLNSILDEIPRVDEVMLMTFSMDASVLHGFTRNHATLRTQLSDVPVDDVPTNWERLPVILEPLLKQKPRPKIVIASDFAGLPNAIQKQIPFRSISVGKAQENVAITHAQLQPSHDNIEEQTFFLQVTNYSQLARESEVEIFQNKNLVDVLNARIGPVERKEFLVPLRIAEPSLIIARLKPSDFLELDNEFRLHAEPVKKITVQLSIDHPYVIRALRALPAVEVASKGPIEIGSPDKDPERAGIFFLKGKHSETRELIQWNRTHPVLRFVDPGLWRFTQYRTLKLPVDGQPLLEAVDGIVAYVAGHAATRRVVLAFPFEQSNLGIFGGFPVFLSNALEWIHAGLKPTLSTLTNSTRSKEGPFTENNTAGFANFADRIESDIKPQTVVGSALSEQQTSLLRKERSSWILFTLLCVTMLEWYAFHKRYEA